MLCREKSVIGIGDLNCQYIFKDIFMASTEKVQYGYLDFYLNF